MKNKKPNPKYLELLRKIFKIRKEKQIGQKNVAAALEMSIGNYSRIERGETLLTTEDLIKIEAVLGLKPGELLSASNSNSEPPSIPAPPSTDKEKNSLIEKQYKLIRLFHYVLDGVLINDEARLSHTGDFEITPFEELDEHDFDWMEMNGYIIKTKEEYEKLCLDWIPSTKPTQEGLYKEFYELMNCNSDYYWAFEFGLISRNKELFDRFKKDENRKIRYAGLFLTEDFSEIIKTLEPYGNSEGIIANNDLLNYSLQRLGINGENN